MGRAGQGDSRRDAGPAAARAGTGGDRKEGAAPPAIEAAGAALPAPAATPEGIGALGRR